MFEKQLIIVGIDPGTNVGYAILDLNGNLIKVESAKELDLGSLISKIIYYGKVLVVGTDKQRTPSFVNDFAVKTGGIVISPKEDIKVEEKEQLTKEFEFKGDHQKDALASSILAYKKIKNLLNKIEEFVKNNKKENLKNKIVEIVIKNYGISIKSALDILEKPAENQIIKRIIETRRLKEEDFFKLNERLRFIEDENRLLKAQNSKLKNESDNIQNIKNKLSAKPNFVSDNKLRGLAKEREIRLNFLLNDLRIKDAELNKADDETRKLLRFLASTNENILLKKVDNLGSIEFENKKSILNIKDDDVLLVKNPNIMSQNVYDSIKEKINIIVYKERPSKKIFESLNFIFIDAKNLDIEENDYFALVDKKEFEKSIEKDDILKKVLREYKSSQP